MQDRQHYFKVPLNNPDHDAVTLLHALRELEQDEGKAKHIGEAGRAIIEEVLTPDNVQRCVVDALTSNALQGGFDAGIGLDADSDCSACSRRHSSHLTGILNQ